MLIKYKDRSRSLFLRTVSLLVVFQLLLNDISFAISDHPVAGSSGSCLAPGPGSLNPAVKRQAYLLGDILSGRLIFADEAADRNFLEKLNGAEALLLGHGKVLVSGKFRHDPLKLIRKIIHEEIEAILQIMAKEDRVKYSHLMNMVLSSETIRSRYYDLFAQGKKPISDNELLVNDIIATAFELLIPKTDHLIESREITAAESEFIKAIEPIINANKHNYFTGVFWDPRVREMKIRIAMANGMKFYQVSSSSGSSGTVPSPIPDLSPQLEQATRQRLTFFNNREAHDLASAINEALGGTDFKMIHPNPRVTIKPKRYDVEADASKDIGSKMPARVMRVGPAIFIIINCDPHDDGQELSGNIARLKDEIERNLGKETLASYKEHASNILFAAPTGYFAFTTEPIGRYTTPTIGAMLSRAESFKDAVVLDVGAGDGLLSRTALRLGAAKVVLVEKHPASAARSRILLAQDGWNEGEHFIVLDKDLADPQLKNAVEEYKPTVALANIGPFYGDANEKALELITALPGITLAINGGHLAYFDKGDLRQTDSDASREYRCREDARRLLRRIGKVTQFTYAHTLGFVAKAEPLVEKSVLVPDADKLQGAVSAPQQMSETAPMPARPYQLPLPFSVGSEAVVPLYSVPAIKKIQHSDGLKNQGAPPQKKIAPQGFVDRPNGGVAFPKNLSPDDMNLIKKEGGHIFSDDSLGKGFKWPIFDTSFGRINALFRRGLDDSLYEKIFEMAKSKAGQPLYVLDWGAGNLRAVRDLCARLKADGIGNVYVVAFGDIYDTSVTVPENAIFIVDTDKNLKGRIAKHLPPGAKIDVIYSYLGFDKLIGECNNSGDAERMRQYIVELGDLLSESGFAFSSFIDNPTKVIADVIADINRGAELTFWGGVPGERFMLLIKNSRFAPDRLKIVADIKDRLRRTWKKKDWFEGYKMLKEVLKSGIFEIDRAELGGWMAVLMNANADLAFEVGQLALEKQPQTITTDDARMWIAAFFDREKYSYAYPLCVLALKHKDKDLSVKDIRYWINRLLENERYLMTAQLAVNVMDRHISGVNRDDIYNWVDRCLVADASVRGQIAPLLFDPLDEAGQSADLRISAGATDEALLLTRAPMLARNKFALREASKLGAAGLGDINSSLDSLGASIRDNEKRYSHLSADAANTFEQEYYSLAFILELILPGSVDQLRGMLTKGKNYQALYRFLDAKRSALLAQNTTNAISNLMQRIESYKKQSSRKAYKIQIADFFNLVDIASSLVDAGYSQILIDTTDRFNPAEPIERLREELNGIYLEALGQSVDLRDLKVNPGVFERVHKKFVSSISQFMRYVKRDSRRKIMLPIFKSVVRAMLEDRFRDFIENEAQDDQIGRSLAKHNRSIRQALKELNINVSRWLGFDARERMHGRKFEHEYSVGGAVTAFKRDSFRIRPYFRDPARDLFIGNMVQSCVALSSQLHPEAMVERLIDEGMNVLEVIDDSTSQTVAALWLYITTDGDLVIQNIDFSAKYKTIPRLVDKVGEELIDYAVHFAAFIGAKRMVIGTPEDLGEYFQPWGLVEKRYSDSKVKFGKKKIGGYFGYRYFLNTERKPQAYLVADGKDLEVVAERMSDASKVSSLMPDLRDEPQLLHRKENPPMGGPVIGGLDKLQSFARHASDGRQPDPSIDIENKISRFRQEISGLSQMCLYDIEECLGQLKRKGALGTIGTRYIEDVLCAYGNIAHYAKEYSSPAFFNLTDFLTNDTFLKAFRDDFSPEERRLIIEYIKEAPEYGLHLSSEVFSSLGSIFTNDRLLNIFKNKRISQKQKHLIFESIAELILHPGRSMPSAFYQMAKLILNDRFLDLMEGNIITSKQKIDLLLAIRDVPSATGPLALQTLLSLIAMINDDKFFAVLHDGLTSSRRDLVFGLIRHIPASLGTSALTGFSSLRECFDDADFITLIRGGKLTEGLKTSLIGDCFTDAARSGLHERIASDPSLFFGPENLKPYVRLGIAAAFSPGLLGEITGRLRDDEGRLDILTHPVFTGLYAMSRLDERKVFGPESNIAPRIISTSVKDVPESLTKLEDIFRNAPLEQAGRSLKSNDGRVLKFMSSSEDINAFFSEPQYYEMLAKSNDEAYEGIVPQPIMNRVTGKYPMKIKAKDLEGKLSADTLEKLYKTQDGFCLCFAYQAEPDYFNYEEGLTQEGAVKLIGSLAVLVKKFGIAHMELIDLFHNRSQGRDYTLNSNPLGRMSNISKSCLFSNFRARGTIADLSPDHLRMIPTQGLSALELGDIIRYQLFQWILFVADRYQKQGKGAWELEATIREGVRSYLSKLLAEDISSELNWIDYVYYSDLIMGKFNDKDGTTKTDLGKFNCALSCHAMIDLVEYIALTAAMRLQAKDERFVPAQDTSRALHGPNGFMARPAGGVAFPEGLSDDDINHLRQQGGYVTAKGSIDRGFKWACFDTSFNDIDNRFAEPLRGSLYEKIIEKAKASPERPVYVMDWGAGNLRAVRELSKRLRGDGIDNVYIIAFGNIYDASVDVPENTIFIVDTSRNIGTRLAKYLPEGERVDIIYSHLGFSKVIYEESNAGREEELARDITELGNLLAGDGFAISDFLHTCQGGIDSALEVINKRDGAAFQGEVVDGDTLLLKGCPRSAGSESAGRTVPDNNVSEQTRFTAAVHGLAGVSLHSYDALTGILNTRIAAASAQSGQSLILDADYVLKAAMVLKLDETLESIAAKQTVLAGGKIILYAKDPAHSLILERMIRRANPNIETVRIEQNQLSPSDDDVKGVESLLRLARAKGAGEILGLIRGPTKEPEELAEFAKRSRLPIIIVGTENGVYSFAQAIAMAVAAKMNNGAAIGWLMMLPPIETLTEDVRKQYEEYLRSLVALAAA